MDLKQSLSLRLQDELEKNLMPDEAVVISLPGSFGECLAVTETRIFVIRERVGVGLGCDVYIHPLSKVEKAEVTASGLGGHIELKLKGYLRARRHRARVLPRLRRGRVQGCRRSRKPHNRVAARAGGSPSAGIRPGRDRPKRGQRPGSRNRLPEVRGRADTAVRILWAMRRAATARMRQLRSRVTGRLPLLPGLWQGDRSVERKLPQMRSPEKRLPRKLLHELRNCLASGLHGLRLACVRLVVEVLRRLRKGTRLRQDGPAGRGGGQAQDRRTAR